MMGLVMAAGCRLLVRILGSQDFNEVTDVFQLVQNFPLQLVSRCLVTLLLQLPEPGLKTISV